jgi:hypothetical protein
MLALLTLSALLASDFQDVSAEVNAAQLESMDLLDLAGLAPESQGQPQRPADGWASVGMQFGYLDMKDADDMGTFFEMQLDLPLGGNWLAQYRIGMGSGDPGFSFTYFSAGVAYDIPLSPSAAANVDRWSLRPFVHVAYQINEQTVPAEDAYALATGNPFVDDLAVTFDNSYGFMLGGQLMRSQGRLDVSVTIGYRFMDADFDVYGLAGGTTPVFASDTADLSGFMIGVSANYRF